ncbi:3-dehydroquinate synthase [Sulfoacidibacillus thermotolerans]|uniref:3-dehydroquinate synthase n=1 Tax=Sulfoacidibacillus thermotolerans TaxID=1765684 RepID=A0A2U3D767_SULT2|nr:3-dehydroquinate synthase [Sulfoacidibacillus thermotolerans]
MTGTPKELTVTAQQGDYKVVIGTGLLQQASSWLTSILNPKTSLMIVYDAKLESLGYVKTLEQSLKKEFVNVYSFAVESGESSKSLQHAARLYSAFLAAGLDRRSAVLALGGGVIGDLAGFAAATFMRGIDFVQIPTTLLAHDASIGGKVAINLPEGKNLVGAFHAPRLVLYDVATLQTLPLYERSSGLAEAIKHGVIYDPELFAYIEEHVEPILLGDSDALTHLLYQSCKVKAKIVSQDERESGIRAFLNFGHTIGHAIEALQYGYYTHGAAVAIGMIYETKIARRLGKIDVEFEDRLRVLLEKAQLPTSLPAEQKSKEAIDALIEHMRRDKKAHSRSLPFILPERLGTVSFEASVDEAVVRQVLAD